MADRGARVSVTPRVLRPHFRLGDANEAPSRAIIAADGCGD